MRILKLAIFDDLSDFLNKYEQIQVIYSYNLFSIKVIENLIYSAYYCSLR